MTYAASGSPAQVGAAPEGRLEDLAIVGNCQYNALIDRYGGVVWLCWPRFDASFVFGSLVDARRGGAFRVELASGRPGTRAYVPNTNVLRTVFEDDSGAFELLDVAPRFAQNDRYVRPTLLLRRLRPLAGAPVVRITCRPVAAYGATPLVPAVGASHLDFAGAEAPLRLSTDGSVTMIAEERPFVLTGAQHLALAWGRPLEAPLRATFDDFYERTVHYWQRWVKHCQLPSARHAEVIRSALVLKLHQFEDTGAIIAATTTSIPEAPGSTRNWDYRYCWLRDAVFTVEALHKLSHFEELEGFERFLRNVAETAPFPLKPVYTVSGGALPPERTLEHLAGYRGERPVRIGNGAESQTQNDVYGEVILALSPLCLDARFATAGGGVSGAPPLGLVRRLAQEILARRDHVDAGLWEYRGRAAVHTFTWLMHWAGLSRAEAILRHHAATPPSADALRELDALAAARDELARDIRARYRPRRGAIVQALDGEFLDASLLMLVNMGLLHRDEPLAREHVLATAAGLAATNGHIRRYAHDDDFGATENAFVLCGFWLAEALARVGDRAAAAALFDRLAGAANDVGLLAEDLDPITGELWGNFPQAYSHVGLINAAFTLYPPWT